MGFRAVLYSAFAVTLVAHVFFYLSLVRFFGIERKAYKRALAAVLGFLAISFLPAHWLTHRYENAFTMAFSLMAGLWVGSFLHLFIASVIGRAVLYVSDRVGRPASPRPVGILFLGIAMAYSVYGVHNAFNPVIRDVSVTIKGLPEKLNRARIVQFSDVHLGQVHGSGFMERVVRLANSAEPDAVLITGDLFDGRDGDMYDLALPLGDLRAPLGVYFVSGNHDRHIDGEAVGELLGRLGVRVLDDEVVNVEGLQLVGVSYRRRGDGTSPADVIRGLPGYDQDGPAVLMCHSPVGAEALRENAAAGIDLQLSGHTHNGQLFPFGIIANAVYDGYGYGLYKVGGMALYVTDGAGSWGPPMRTGTPPEIVRITLYRG